MMDYDIEVGEREEGYDTAGQRVVMPGFFSDDELTVFGHLISSRRCLPVYCGDFWTCYECDFMADRFDVMARHIMTEHKPAPMRSYLKSIDAKV
jgi:hypothetical protein